MWTTPLFVNIFAKPVFVSDVAVVVGVGAALGEELFVAAAGPDAVAVLAHCGGGEAGKGSGLG